jgi:SAM-dependent methyltransferase
MARIAQAVARHLPEALVPVFTPGFARSHLLLDEFVFRLTVRVAAAAGLVEAAREWGTGDEILERAGLDPRSRVPVDWMLRHLAARGVLARDDAGRFRCDGALPDLDPAEVLAEQRRHDPACLPAYALAETAARDYPQFLQGKRSGDDILLAPARLPLWSAYFSNDNPLYAVNNRVGAVALEAWLAPEATTILELGGGLASGALAALERLAAAGRLARIERYRFTELVPAFLQRGQRRLQERFPGLSSVTFGRLDMNRPFAAQGVEPGSTSAVYAVNTLHVAHDLAFTLGEIRAALRPGGQLIVSEGVRPWPGQTLYPEFVFNVMETFRAPRLHPVYRPTGGFLTPGQWTLALEAAGFRDIRVLPDIDRIREVFPTFYVAALGAVSPA